MNNIVDRLVNRLALPLVLGTLVVVPLGSWFYEKTRSLAPLSEGVKVFNIYFDGTKGWSLKRIGGYNYWLSRENGFDEIQVEKGDEVILRLLSMDNEHVFWMKDLGVGPVELKPGYLKEIRFKATRAGVFPMVCNIYCGKAHGRMNARLRVVPKRSEYQTLWKRLMSG